MSSVIVTGGNGSIGKYVARIFYDNDYEVFVIDKNNQNDSKFNYLECNLTDYNIIKKVLSSSNINNVSSLICLAGGAIPEEWGKFIDLDISVFRESIKQNLMTHINTIHATLPYLIQSTEENKSILLLSSINSKASYSLPAYSAAKAALEGLMYGLAKELSEYNIRINTISAGTVKTRLSESEKGKDWNKLLDQTYFGEFTKTEDIASLIYSVCQNSSINCQNYIIDCGQISKR